MPHFRKLHAKALGSVLLVLGGNRLNKGNIGSSEVFLMSAGTPE